MVDYDTAAQAVQDESADPALLARIAYENPEFGPNVAAHPRAYPGLLAWIAQFGTQEAKDIVAKRSADLPVGATISDSQPQVRTSTGEFATQSPSSAAEKPANQPTPSQANDSVAQAENSAQKLQQAAVQSKPTVQAQPAVQSRPSVQVQPAVQAQPSHGFTAQQAMDPTTDPMTQHNIAEYAPELRVYLAQNPNVYPELLAWLGSLNDPQINAAIATRR